MCFKNIYKIIFKKYKLFLGILILSGVVFDVASKTPSSLFNKNITANK